jgi:catechol 2,3-dioxygenase-like lactoylglutathione lyase family enzyme
MDQIEALVDAYESRILSRRQLVGALAAIVAGAAPAASQPAPIAQVAQGRTLNHASLAVTDVAAAALFYQKLLGLKVVSRPGNGGINLGLGDAFLGVWSRGALPPAVRRDRNKPRAAILRADSRDSVGSHPQPAVRSPRRFAMATDRIDFISAYCDRWCERCAFTERCSAYACTVATAMCDGDVSAGLELAIGLPQPVGGDREKTAGELLLDEFEEPSAEEIAAAVREEEARAARIDTLEISQLARAYSVQSRQWLTGNEPQRAHADPLVREALEIAGWDSTLISAKLHRALRGRERSREAPLADDHPLKSDANGSAKVALISLERSEASWRLVADAIADTAALDLALMAARLRAHVVEEFPAAIAFIRPGFDEPWR